MTIKVLAENCDITKMPSGWSAKTNGEGSCLIDFPDGYKGIFARQETAKNTLNINNIFEVEALKKSSPIVMTRILGEVEEEGFYELKIVDFF